MAKKAKKRARKSRTVIREWALGQPLAFPKKKNPTDINLLARSDVEAAIEKTLTPKRQRDKRK